MWSSELAKISQDYLAPTVEQKIPIYLFTNIFATVHLNIFTVEGLNKKETKKSVKQMSSGHDVIGN